MKKILVALMVVALGVLVFPNLVNAGWFDSSDYEVTPCYGCGGSGICGACGGSGYIEQYDHVKGYYHEGCGACGTSGLCSACGVSGIM